MFKQREVIASVHHDQALRTVLHQDQVETIFIIDGDILQLPDTIKRIRAAEKRVFLHIDTVQGLSTDMKGVEYVARKLKPDGILSTRGQIIQMARKMNLLTIQRLFLIDSNALSSGVRSIKNSCPDAVEVMPGLMPRVVKELCSQIKQPVVAGGLLKTAEEINAVLDAGAIAVSLSNLSYWKE